MNRHAVFLRQTANRTEKETDGSHYAFPTQCYVFDIMT
jgi:hypothetical protein